MADVPRVVQTVGGHGKLSLAKLVELRRRSRIDRARQLASNIETQAQIMRSTELYNLEAARLQLDRQLGGMGQNVPQVAQSIHHARLAMLTEEVADLRRQQREAATLISNAGPRPTLRPTIRRNRPPLLVEDTIQDLFEYERSSRNSRSSSRRSTEISSSRKRVYVCANIAREAHTPHIPKGA